MPQKPARLMRPAWTLVFGLGLGLCCGLGALAGGPRSAEAGTLYISAQDGIAIGGYDPVSFFVAPAPLPGRSDHAVMWKGAVWMFENAENQARFEADPRAFAPRYGGHCAYGIARGKIASGDPLSWEIVEGRLYLFHTPRAEDLWRGDSAEMIAAAREVWPGIMRGH